MAIGQSILEAYIEPTENESNYAPTPGRGESHLLFNSLSNEEAVKHLKKALKSPRYGGLRNQGIEN